MFQKFSFLFIPLLAIAAALCISSCNKTDEVENDASAKVNSAGMTSNAEPNPAPSPNPEPVAAESQKKDDAKVFVIESVQDKGNGKAAEFTWTENGKKMSFSELTDGKIVFLNFWGTWCPPCRRELPDIVDIYKDDIKDLMIIGIAVNERGRTAEDKVKLVKNFAENSGLPYRILVSHDRKVEKAFGGVSAVPTTFIIDHNGNIGETIVGARNKETFMKSIKRVMKK